MAYARTMSVPVDRRRTEAMRKHVADMLAVESHTLDVITRQRETDRLTLLPEANSTVLTIESMLAKHVATLECYLEGFGAEHRSAMTSAIAKMTGTLAGLYDRMRDHEVSRMLRDDYTALSLAAISYEMLHTAGLAHGEVQIARIALRHLQEITPQIVELSRIVPHVVAAEIASEEGGDASVALEAERNTHRAWAQELRIS